MAVFNIAGDVAFTVLGAIAVSALTALVTARTTNQRLDKQLAAEQARLELQLGAEERRQLEQLRHERELSDLAELRNVLDEAAHGMSQAVKTAAYVATNWQRRTESKDAEEQLPEQREQLLQQGLEIAEYQIRIMLRLPPDSAAIEAMDDTRAAISRLGELSSRPLENDEEAQYMAERRGAHEVGDAHLAFLSAARELVGSALPGN